METSYETRIINHALKTCGYYPLRAIQLWLVDTHFNKVNSTMMNIGAFMQLSPQVDLPRLAQAINDVINSYDIFRCRLVFHPETDDFCQRFDGEIVPVTVEKISYEEFERRKTGLMNKPLYRIYLLETPTAKYSYNGRNTALKRRIMGIMLEQFPISWDFTKNITVGEFLDGLEQKMNLGITIGGYPTQIIELPPNEISAAENTLDVEVNRMETGEYLFLDYNTGILDLQDEKNYIAEILS